MTTCRASTAWHLWIGREGDTLPVIVGSLAADRPARGRPIQGGRARRRRDRRSCHPACERHYGLRCADRTSTRRGSEEAANLGHNQQIVGDKIYLSGYHSGVTVLDASAAFAGKRGARPRELAFVVPSGTPTRPLYDQVVGPAIPFVSTFTQARPLVWDQVFYIPPGAGPKAGRILAADITGGFYSYREAGAR
jgi:hypothetical protein